MLYLKILRGAEIVAAEAHESPVYVRRQTNGVVVRCSEVQAQGVLSLDGSQNYQLFGRQALGDTECSAEKIYAAEYDTLLTELDEQETDQAEEQEADEPQEEGRLTIAQMREKIATLESTVDELTESNQMLTECLLEMSELVYV